MAYLLIDKIDQMMSEIGFIAGSTWIGCLQREIILPLEASKWVLLVIPFHFQLQKAKVELIGWFSKPTRFDKTVLSLIEEVNKNY